MARKVPGAERGARPVAPAIVVATLPVLPRPGPHAIGQVFVSPPPERTEEAVILLPS